MKRLALLFILSGIFSLAQGQVQRWKEIDVDSTLEGYDSSYMYYYGIKEKNHRGNGYSVENTPFTFADNRFQVFTVYLNKDASAKKIDTFQILSDTSAHSFLKAGTIELNKIYSSGLLSNLIHDSILKKSGLVVINWQNDNKRRFLRSVAFNVPIAVNSSILSLDGAGIRTDSFIFRKQFSALDNSFKLVYLRNAHFYDTFEIGYDHGSDFFSEAPGAAVGNKLYTTIFHSCEFNSLFSVYDDRDPSADEPQFYIPILSAGLNLANGGPLFESRKMGFSNVHFNGDVIFHSIQLKDMLFENVAFRQPLFLAGKRLDSVIFIHCDFQKLLDIRKTAFVRGTLFKGCYFPDNCNLLMDPDDNINQFGLEAAALEKIFFIIDWGWPLAYRQYMYWDADKDEFALRKYPSYFREVDSTQDPLNNFDEKQLVLVSAQLQRIRDYAYSTIKSDDLLGSGKQKIANWLTYQQYQYEKLYYQKHGWLHYVWLCFLERVVNFGYKGEGKFATFCLAIIFIFSLIYRIRFQQELAAYLNKETGPGFVKAFYLSFVIFFTPKFPVDVFNRGKAFLWFIIIEWSVGLLFILLFLFYIAGNYPIVSRLLGL